MKPILGLTGNIKGIEEPADEAVIRFFIAGNTKDPKAQAELRRLYLNRDVGREISIKENAEENKIYILLDDVLLGWAPKRITWALRGNIKRINEGYIVRLKKRARFYSAKVELSYTPGYSIPEQPMRKLHHVIFDD